MAYEHPEELPLFQTTYENGYDSDKIDSDIEDMLYASIHHQTINSEELSFTPIKPNESLNDDDDDDPCELLTPKIRNIFNERKTVKKKKIKELKNLKRKNQTNEQQNDVPLSNSTKRTKILADQLDISYGHNIAINCTDTTNGFYLEANYDNEDIDEVIKKLPKDRRYWKVGQQDLQSFFHRRGRHRPKQCNLCLQFGHLDRLCPN
ncbi:hypothetical protein BLA29_011199, partial [Euroglyphus maynei]